MMTAAVDMPIHGAANLVVAPHLPNHPIPASLGSKFRSVSLSRPFEPPEEHKMRVLT